MDAHQNFQVLLHFKVYGSLLPNRMATVKSVLNHNWACFISFKLRVKILFWNLETEYINVCPMVHHKMPLLDTD